MSKTISFEKFKEVEIRMGKVLECEKVEGADKLLRLQVDFGEFDRQIIAGIALCYTPEEIKGKTLPFVVNLEPRILKGEESQGMLLATKSNVAGAGSKKGEDIVLLEPNKKVAPGTEVV